MGLVVFGRRCVVPRSEYRAQGAVEQFFFEVGLVGSLFNRGVGFRIRGGWRGWHGHALSADYAANDAASIAADTIAKLACRLAAKPGRELSLYGA